MLDDDPRIDPADLRQARFSGSFRRYDAKAVDDFLESVAERIVATNAMVDDLRHQLEAAREAHPSAPVETPSPFEAPDLTGLSDDELVGLIGEETTHVLTTARRAATDIRTKAEESAARLIREATAEAAELTEEASASAAALTAEAESVRDAAVAAAEADAEKLRTAAATEADEVVAAGREAAEAITASAEEVRRAAEEEAARIIEEAKNEGRAMVAEAKKVRSRVLEDLQRRRDLGRSQVERLAAGRDQLLEAYAAVRANLDEITGRLEAGLLEAGAGPDPLLEDGFAGIVISGLDADTDDSDDPDHGESADAGEIEDPGISEADGAAVVDDDGAGDAPADRLPADEERDELPADEGTDADPGPGNDEVDDAPAEDVPAEDADAEDVPADGADAEDVASGDAEAEDVPAEGGDVDALFAKIRADRAQSVARAQRVLAGEVDGTDGAEEPQPTETQPAETQPTEGGAPVGTDADVTDAGTDRVPAELLAGADALARRAEVIDPLDKDLSRALKRHLADEQNQVLDALRRTESTAVEELLPSLEDHVAGYAAVAAVQLSAAARAGAGGTGTEIDVDVSGLAAELGASLIESFRRRIERSAADVDGDADAFDERLRALYREWKVEHIGAATTDALLSAYGLGQHAGAPDDAALRWLIDPEQGPCPDAQDNALAGAVPKGESFPTGDACPQAHPGCRCLLVLEP